MFYRAFTFPGSKPPFTLLVVIKNVPFMTCAIWPQVMHRKSIHGFMLPCITCVRRCHQPHCKWMVWLLYNYVISILVKIIIHNVCMYIMESWQPVYEPHFCGFKVVAVVMYSRTSMELLIVQTIILSSKRAIGLLHWVTIMQPGGPGFKSRLDHFLIQTIEVQAIKGH